MCFLPLQQVILIASDLLLTEQTISASLFRATVLILKVISTTENMRGNSSASSLLSIQ